MTRRIVSGVVLAALALAALPASAQVSSVYQTPVTDLLGQQLRYNSWLNQSRKVLGHGSGASGTTPLVDPLRPVGPGITTINPATHFTAAGGSTVPEAYAALAKGDDSTHAQLVSFYRSLLTMYDQTLVQNRATMRRNDVAAADEYATEAAYYVASGGIELSNASGYALLAQFENVLSNSPVKTMSDTEKQKAYDSSVILAGLMLELKKYADQNNDPSMAAYDRALANQLLVTFCGAPWTGLDFTPQGVTTKR